MLVGSLTDLRKASYLPAREFAPVIPEQKEGRKLFVVTIFFEPPRSVLHVRVGIYLQGEHPFLDMVLGNQGLGDLDSCPVSNLHWIVGNHFTSPSSNYLILDHL